MARFPDLHAAWEEIQMRLSQARYDAGNQNLFLLLAPEGAGAGHLKALARIARLLRDQDIAKKLRASRDAQAIYSVLALPPASAA